MESGLTIVTIESIILAVVNVVVMYTVILQHRLPYSQVVLSYAGLMAAGAILMKILSPKVMYNETKRPIDVRAVSHQVVSALGVGLLDLLMGVGAFIAVIIIASYRFSMIEILGMIAAGSASSIVARGVLGAL